MGQQVSGSRIGRSLLCRRSPDLKILILGLDAAGKTTLLYRLKTGEALAATIPTIGFNVESVALEGVANLTLWDTGGRDKMRPLFRHYFPNTGALAFVIDATDRARLDDALADLASFAREDDLRSLPIAVLCNKCDLCGDGTDTPDVTAAAAVADVQQRLLADKVLVSVMRSHPHCCFAVSAMTGEGLAAAVTWLVQAALCNERNKAATVANPDSAWTYWLCRSIKSSLIR